MVARFTQRTSTKAIMALVEPPTVMTYEPDELPPRCDYGHVEYDRGYHESVIVTAVCNWDLLMAIRMACGNTVKPSVVMCWSMEVE